MATQASSGSSWPIVRKILLGVGMTGLVVVFMLLLLRVFHEKVDESVAVTTAGRPIGDTQLVDVKMITQPVRETAVGTVEPVQRIEAASKLLATIRKIHVNAGDQVKKGDILVELDDADLKARVDQASAALDQARQSHQLARTEFDRVEKLHKQNAAADIELNRARTALDKAESARQQAEHALQEAKTILGYATIEAPMAGTVIDKLAEEGDTANPGQVLVVLYDRMQLVARVRESLTNRLAVGQEIDVSVEALGHGCAGTISEIVPEAESSSRTFTVKVTGPCPPGVYPGMFGRLSIPLDDEQILVIPEAAVRQVGQLEMVDVVHGEVLLRRSVRLGPVLDDRVQVLSGLREGERVALWPAGNRDQGG